MKTVFGKKKAPMKSNLPVEHEHLVHKPETIQEGYIGTLPVIVSNSSYFILYETRYKDQDVVVKVARASKDGYADFYKECTLLEKFDHPNIIRPLAFEVGPIYFFCILPRATKGTLAHYTDLSWLKRLEILQQIASADRKS